MVEIRIETIRPFSASLKARLPHFLIEILNNNNHN